MGGAQKYQAGSRFLVRVPVLTHAVGFGSESDTNSNCSSLAWSASFPSSSYKLYPRRRDKRIFHDAVAGKTLASYPGRLGGEKRPGIHCMRMREYFSKFSVKFYVKSQSQKLACTEVNYRWSIR